MFYQTANTTVERPHTTASLTVTERANAPRRNLEPFILTSNE